MYANRLSLSCGVMGHWGCKNSNIGPIYVLVLSSEEAVRLAPNGLH